MVLIQIRVNHVLNLLQTEHKNIIKLQVKKVQWKDYHQHILMKPLLLACYVQDAGQLSLWSEQQPCLSF